LKVLTLAGGIDFPHAAQAMPIKRRRRALDQPKRWRTETVYAITNLQVHQAKPAHLAAAVRGHWSIENNCTGSATSATTKIDHRSAPAPDRKSWPLFATPAISALRLADTTHIAAANRHHAPRQRPTTRSPQDLTTLPGP
jgi:hypothetical protein